MSDQKKRPTVGVDVDGILADFVAATLGHLHAVTGVRADPEKITTWEIFASLPAEVQHAKAEVYERFRLKGGCRSIPVIAGASAGVARLRDVADVIAITAPFQDAPTWMQERTWFLRDCYAFKAHEVVHAIDKRRMHVDIFVDDKPSNVAEWQEYWAPRDPACRGYLWTTPRTQPADLKMPHVSSWDELQSKVESFRR